MRPILLGLSSSETQGQIVGTRESLNGREKNGAKKSKNGEKHSVLYFSSRHFFRPFRLSLAPTIYSWVSEDDGLFQEEKNTIDKLFRSYVCSYSIT